MSVMSDPADPAGPAETAPARIQERVIAILAEQALLEPSEVQLTDTLDDLAIDSLGLVEAIFSIEESFDIQVPFNANDPADSAFDISSVAAIVEAVRRLVAEQTDAR